MAADTVLAPGFALSAVQCSRLARYHVMYGNRRFAQKMRQERSVGHSMGFAVLRN